MANPSIKQALNRMNHGHFRLLKSLATASAVTSPQDSDGAILGLRKCAKTLSGWGAIERGSLTPFGQQLYDAARTSVRPRFV